MSNTEKMTDRVRKLFAQAESVKGTPEADVFLQRAMELSARYGIEEAVAKAGAGTDSSEIITWEFYASGKYRYDQVMLIGSIANALHSHAVRSGSDKNKVTVYGAKRHIDRIALLGGFLVAHMLATVGKAQSDDPRIPTVTYKKSVAAGYAVTVAKRLREAESAATHGSEDSGKAEIVLASDSKRADAFMRQQLGRLRNAPGARRSSAGYGAGAEAANSVDLGGGRNRVGGRRAISA